MCWKNTFWELKTLCQSKLLLIIEEIFKSMHFHDGCSHFSRMYTFSLSVEKHVLGSQGRRELNYLCCKTNFCFKLKGFNKGMHFVCVHISVEWTLSKNVLKSTLWEVLGIELSAAKQSSADHACIAIAVLSSTCKVHKQSVNVKRANFSVCHCRAV